MESEEQKPRRFADRIALQQARQAEIDHILEQQMRDLDIVTPQNPRRFQDKIALQKQRQDDLQKIIATVSPSAATLKSGDYEAGSNGSEPSRPAQQQHPPLPTPSGGGGPPPPQYWREPTHYHIPHDGPPNNSAAPYPGQHRHQHQQQSPYVADNPAAMYGSAPIREGGYDYYSTGQQQAAMTQHTPSAVIPHHMRPAHLPFGSPAMNEHEAGYGRGSPYGSPQVFRNSGPRIFAPELPSEYTYDTPSSPGIREVYARSPTETGQATPTSAFLIDSLLKPSTPSSAAQNSMGARRERGGSVRVKRQVAVDDPFANRRATSMRLKKPGQRARIRSVDAAMADYQQYNSAPVSPGALSPSPSVTPQQPSEYYAEPRQYDAPMN